MYESVRGRAKRVLVVGTPDDTGNLSPAEALAPDGWLIIMESDPARAAALRTQFLADPAGAHATVIGGDPRRMLYKLAGPFDVIFCSSAYLFVRPTLENLLAPDGVLITDATP